MELNSNERMLLEYIANTLLCGQMQQLMREVNDDEEGEFVEHTIRVESYLLSERNGMLMEQITKNEDYLRYLVEHTKYHEVVFDETMLYHLLPGISKSLSGNEILKNKSFKECIRIIAKRNLRYKYKSKIINIENRRNFKIIKCD